MLTHRRLLVPAIIMGLGLSITRLLALEAKATGSSSAGPSGSASLISSGGAGGAR
jgi:hypothetical protein